MRKSGSLDFFWNYRIVADISVKNRLIDGFIDDVDFDNGFVYYNQITFEGTK